MAGTTIERKSRHELNLMRTAGQIVAETLELVAQSVKPGMSTLELDQIAEKNIRAAGAIPTFIGYHGIGQRFVHSSFHFDDVFGHCSFT